MRVSGLDLIEGNHAKSWIVCVGRIRERNSERPDRSGHKSLALGRCSDAISPFTALLGRLFIDVPGQRFEKRISDDLRIKLGIFAAAMLARIFYKKLTLGDARSAEGIGLDDVRACLQKPPMDVSNHLWLGQREQVPIV